MKAVVAHSFGGPEVLRYEDAPAPEPGPGEVTVRVHAAGVGNWDALVREGKSGLGQTLPLIPGADLAGTVAAVGASAGGFRPGELVYGATNPRFTGAYAEVALCDAGMIARKPAALNFVEAASAPVVAVTAWQMLFEFAKVSARESVLVQGGGGNVGAYAVALAKISGAKVVTTASASDRDYLEGLGAAVIDFRAERFEDVVSGVDIVIDTVGGATLSRSFSVVRPGGIVVSSVAEPAEEEAKRANARTAFFIVSVTTRRLDALTPLFEAGILKPRVGETLPMEKACEAHAMLADARHPPGRIVLSTGA
ncbi:MAG: NADP-dependent oxidoreductase [Candidatus Cybelea sp.]|jgi:NADPH:quinone reductase-like Zn-dependent oxidoreductase